MLRFATFSANSSLGIHLLMKKILFYVCQTVFNSKIQLHKFKQIRCFCKRLLVTKCLEMQFKIASLLRCLLYVDATLVHPLSQVLFYASMIHRSLLSPKSAYMYFYNFASFSLCSSMNMQIPASPDSPSVSVRPTHLVVLLHRGRQQPQVCVFLRRGRPLFTPRTAPKHKKAVVACSSLHITKSPQCLEHSSENFKTKTVITNKATGHQHL